MHRTIHLLTIVGFVVLVAGCSPTQETTSAAATLEVAEQLYQQSQELGFAWRATSESIEAAKAAQQTGDTEAAQLQINRAIALAEASIAQAQREAVDWKTRPPFGQ